MDDMELIIEQLYAGRSEAKVKNRFGKCFWSNTPGDLRGIWLCELFDGQKLIKNCGVRRHEAIECTERMFAKQCAH